MSKIKLPHASGNSMSIAAPATNPASDLELKLPATIGTAGQVLRNSSTPGTLEFGAPGSWVKLSQVLNGGNVSDLTFAGLDTSTYRSFKFIGGMQPATDNVNLRMRVRVGSSNLTNSKYDWGFNLMHPSNTQGGEAVNDDDHFKLFGDSGNTGGEAWHLELLLTPHVDGHAAQIGNAITWQGHRLDENHDFRTSVGAGYFDYNDTYVDGFILYPGSGNFAYHNYTLYGIRA